MLWKNWAGFHQQFERNHFGYHEIILMLGLAGIVLLPLNQSVTGDVWKHCADMLNVLLC